MQLFDLTIAIAVFAILWGLIAGSIFAIRIVNLAYHILLKQPKFSKASLIKLNSQFRTEIAKGIDCYSDYDYEFKEVVTREITAQTIYNTRHGVRDSVWWLDSRLTDTSRIKIIVLDYNARILDDLSNVSNSRDYINRGYRTNRYYVIDTIFHNDELEFIYFLYQPHGHYGLLVRERDLQLVTDDLDAAHIEISTTAPFEREKWHLEVIENTYSFEWERILTP